MSGIARDCALWHISRTVQEWLQGQNAKKTLPTTLVRKVLRYSTFECIKLPLLSGSSIQGATPRRDHEMPYRLLAVTELAEFLRGSAHPRRMQIIEEVQSGERDVVSMAKAMGLAHSSASQHLMVLRAHRVVADRREGRQVFYQLRSVELAEWLGQGCISCRPSIIGRRKYAKPSKKQCPSGFVAPRLTGRTSHAGTSNETVQQDASCAWLCCWHMQRSMVDCRKTRAARTGPIEQSPECLARGTEGSEGAA
jgi:DNA-binding transcriptional ArsR family regulator